MAEFKLKGNSFNTVGDLPAAGADAPDLTLVGADLGDVVLDNIPPSPAGKAVVDVTFRLSVENKVSLSARERTSGNAVECTLNDLVCREEDDQSRDTQPDQGSVDQVLKDFLED